LSIHHHLGGEREKRGGVLDIQRPSSLLHFFPRRKRRNPFLEKRKKRGLIYIFPLDGTKEHKGGGEKKKKGGRLRVRLTTKRGKEKRQSLTECYHYFSPLFPRCQKKKSKKKKGSKTHQKRSKKKKEVGEDLFFLALALYY